MSTSRQPPRHPSERELFEFLNGRINDPDEEDQISQHITSCTECQTTVAQIDDDPFVDQIKKSDHDSSTSELTVGLQRARFLLSGQLTPTTPSQFGKYESIEEVGRGGFGVVWKAYDPTLRRRVALKISRMGTLVTEKEQLRSRTEAMAVAALDHPNIVPVHEVGNIDGMSYIATAFCDGPNLADYLVNNGSLPEKTAAQLVRKLADAINHAHQRGVLHRDLKPANVLMSPIEARLGNSTESFPFEPKIVDFGLAKIRSDGAEESHSHTASGWVGTLQFMAPEQFEKGHFVAASDVYALGAILYQTLTEKAPFEASSTAALIEQVTSQNPMPVRSIRTEISRDLATICEKCLSKSPEQRYHSPAELSDDLARFLRKEPILARRVGAVERVWAWCQRRPLIASLATAVAVLTLISAVIGTSAAWVYRGQQLSLQERLREKTEAERETKRQLLLNNVDQLRMSRLDVTAGRLARGSNAARLAAKLSTELNATPTVVARLRDEAIASAAIVDLQLDWERTTASTCMAFDPQTERYALFSSYQTVELRNKDGQTLKTLRLAEQPTNPSSDWRLSLRFSPNGKYLATGGTEAKNGWSETSACIWDLETGELLRQFKPYGTWYEYGYAFSHDNELFAIAQQDGSVCLFDVITGNNVYTIPSSGGELRRVTNVEFHPTLPLLAISRANQIEIRGKPDYRVIDNFSVEHCQRLCWRPHYREIAITSSDSIVVRRADHIRQGLWSTVQFPKTLIDGPTNAIYDPSGRVLAVTAWDGHTYLVDPDTENLLLEADGHAMGFSNSGQYLAFGSVGEYAGRWKFTLPDAFQQFATPTRSDSGYGFDFGPDGRLVVTVSPTGTFVWDVALQRPVGGFELGASLHSLSMRREDLLLADDRSATLFDFSRDGEAVWTVGKARRIALPPTDQPMQRIGMTPNGIAFATFRDRAAILSPPYDEDSIEEFSLKEVWRPAISPDARYLAFSYYHGTKEYIVDRSVHKIVRSVDGEYGRATFSPDGKWLAIGFAGKTVLCDTETWSERPLSREFTGQQSVMPAFSPDGRILAISNAKSSIQLIDIQTADLKVVAQLISPSRAAVEGIRFSPSGSRLVISTSSNLMQVWDLGSIATHLSRLGIESEFFANDVTVVEKQQLPSVEIRIRQ